MKSSVLVLALLCAVAGSANADMPRRPEQRATTNVVTHPTTPTGYFYTVRGWHTPDANATIQRDASNRQLFVVHAMALNERVAFPAATPRGGFTPDAITHISHTVRESTTGNEHPIDPRTLDVLYQIQTHFNAQEIRVVSAYRTPKVGNSQGNHGRGRAIDFVVPGATDSDVGRFARDHGFVGVGVYPNAGFVHVDVRASSYFWIDSSGPGAPSRERGILLDVAQRADSQAQARGETAPPPILSNGLIPPVEEEDL